MDFEAYLRRHQIRYELHRHPTTYTAQGLAQVEHVSGFMVAKPVIVKGDGGFAMCVLPAPDHVDLERVAGLLGESDVRLATEAEMGDLFPECEVGAEPPIGPLFGMRTLMDPRLTRDEFLVMQAGNHHEAVKVRRADWERMAHPMVAPLTNRADGVGALS